MYIFAFLRQYINPFHLIFFSQRTKNRALIDNKLDRRAAVPFHFVSGRGDAAPEGLHDTESF
jgi:hypothetical protein